MNSMVFKLHASEAAAVPWSQEMWNANSSLAEFCLCSLSLTHCLFFYWLYNWPCAQALNVCVCNFWSNSMPWVRVLISDALTKWPLWNELCGLFTRGEQMHFTAFALWANNLQITRKKRKKPENWIYVLSVQKEETNTDNTFSLQIFLPDPSAWQRLSCLCRFLLQRWLCYISLIICPIIFQTHSSYSLCWAHSRNIDFHRRPEDS